MIAVARNDTLSRYEGRLDDELVSTIDFVRTGDLVDITRTFTRTRWRGQGLAGQATAAALDDIRAQGWRVRPTCPFTAGYLDSHSDYADLRV